MSETPRPVRRILHIDVDAMFVQCAVLADPERLRDEPLILVGGSPEGRGVVTSASYGCRAFGVRSAMPTATALRLCSRAVVVPPPGAVIRARSRALGALLSEWSPVGAMASVDEAYLDLTGTEALYHHDPLDTVARRIQREIRERTELQVSIGGGTNRLVAKLATSFAKPAGVHIVDPGNEDRFVAGIELSRLIGVGPALLADLGRRGVTTMSALRALDLATLVSWWGEDRASWLWRRCRGIDSSPVGADPVTKSVSSETTFAHDRSSRQELERALLGRVVDACASLRRQGLFARTITVKLRDAEFADRSRSRTLAEAVRTDRVVYAVSRELLADLCQQVPTRRYRLIGVSLGNLEQDAEPEQGTLSDLAPPLEAPRDRNLAAAVDRIRARHGGIIGPGGVSDSDRRRG